VIAETSSSVEQFHNVLPQYNVSNLAILTLLLQSTAIDAESAFRSNSQAKVIDMRSLLSHNLGSPNPFVRIGMDRRVLAAWRRRIA
jgi:hypothetical protein